MTVTRIADILKRGIFSPLNFACEFALTRLMAWSTNHITSYCVSRLADGTLPVQSVQFQNRVKQNVCAIPDVFRSGILFRRMTDATDAWNKYHSHGSDSGHVLSIVTGATGHQLCR